MISYISNLMGFHISIRVFQGLKFGKGLPQGFLMCFFQVAESMSAAGEALADAEEGSVVFDI